MINQKFRITVGARKSCTLDEAIARLLGWMQGDKLCREMQLAGYGVADDQLPYVLSLDASPLDFVGRRWHAACIELGNARNANAHQAVLDEKLQAVSHWREEMCKATSYEVAIEAELAKGTKSALRLDSRATKRLGTPCLFFGGLDQWAQKNYKIFMFGTEGDQPVNDSTLVKAVVQEEEDASQLRPDVGKVKANNLYILLAFFVEAFAAKSSSYRDNDEPNAIAIGDQFEAVITAANHNNPLTGHTSENIRKVIAEAMKRKRQKELKKSYVNGVLLPIAPPKA